MDAASVMDDGRAFIFAPARHQAATCGFQRASPAPGRTSPMPQGVPSMWGTPDLKLSRSWNCERASFGQVVDNWVGGWSAGAASQPFRIEDQHALALQPQP